EFEGNAMRARRNLNTRRRHLVGGSAVNQNLCAGRSAFDLRPGDVTGVALGQSDVHLCLYVVFDLNAARIGVVSLQPDNEIVVSGGQRNSGGGLARLLGFVDEDVGTGGLR